MTKRRALITGITGQDGSYLADLLLARGYEVHGMVRRVSTGKLDRIRHIVDRIHLHQADLLDILSIMHVLRDVRPHEVYNLAAQSFVPTSFREPELTANYTALGVLRMIEAIRIVDPAIRFYQASSSEMFGKAVETPQKETTPFHPRSPYGVAKVYGHHITVNYREAYGLHASSGILFNHESCRRGKEFVTRKVALGAARIKRGFAKELRLGNLDALRDWGYAPDYVRAMWLMLQQDVPGEFVVATGRTRTIRELLDAAFGCVDLDWKKHVVEDPELVRPTEVDLLHGDPTRAKQKLGWEPEVSFEQMIKLMVDADLKRLDKIGPAAVNVELVGDEEP
jgi:GDPmannose 4,6-dehydratase